MRTQKLFQFRVARPAPGMNQPVEELGLHIIMIGVVGVDPPLAEQARVISLAGQGGGGVGVRPGLDGFLDLPRQAGGRFGLDALVPAVNRRPVKRTPADQRHPPAHAGVGIDTVTIDPSSTLFAAATVALSHGSGVSTMTRRPISSARRIPAAKVSAGAGHFTCAAFVPALNSWRSSRLRRSCPVRSSHRPGARLCFYWRPAPGDRARLWHHHRHG